MSGYGSLRLTEKSYPLLRGEQTIALRKDPEISKKKLKASEKAKLHSSEIPNDELWRALKQKRLDLAREQSVPPYVIFHDSTLMQIHREKPKTLEEFAHISGVGQTKLQRYAKDFISIIHAYIAFDEKAKSFR